MSEEILKALTQLFAIISKQDGGVTDIERKFVLRFFRQELDKQTLEEYMAVYDENSGYNKREEDTADVTEKKERKSKLTSVKDSVRTLALCKKINKTLNQKQKAIVLIKLLELVASDRAFTPQRMEIINTVSDAFNIPSEEYSLLESFIKEVHSSNLNNDDILIFGDEKPPVDSKLRFLYSGLLDGEIIFIQLKSVGLYFTKYTGDGEIILNGQIIKKNTISQFSPGSVIKTPKGAPLYYSDLVNAFAREENQKSISFNVESVEFKFPNGQIGIRDINISEGPGTLIGIMGASGAGKTTLLNTLAGIERPSKGTVKINGIDIHRENKKIEGVIGYISQDDLLIEELTVYQNLYYNAKLCFKNLRKKEIHEKVVDVLSSLGLEKIKNLRVGSVLNKKISGGQRKRLNIALELIREPSVMFVDEPTSGLSSRDSENVIDLLKELSLKGKLIFVVIHQPSSDIYKMFDKMLLMDTGGYPIFFGNPVEGITYFKSASGQVGSDKGQCTTCGNVNVEQLFNIIESRVVDEYGEFTEKRKVTPLEWHKLFLENHKMRYVEEVKEAPPKPLHIPSKFTQTRIFTIRDFLSKVSNAQYMVINLLEAPLLAALLSLVIRYREDINGEYIFRNNDNIPAYILICIIIALFMGLTVSAEEIIKDRKILKREQFLNLSRSSYLVSKIVTLFLLSAIQTLSFALVGNLILDIEGMNIMYWLALFTVSCHANVIGLNISSAFNSAITVYILIPILLIPQMILSGIIFDYEKLNNKLSEYGKVPLIADFMASRWGYEAIAVEQYKENEYEKHIFQYDMRSSQCNFKLTYWKPEMENLINKSAYNSDFRGDSIRTLLKGDLAIIKNELSKDEYFRKNLRRGILNKIEVGDFNSTIADSLLLTLEDANNYYTKNLIVASEARDSVLYVLSQALKTENMDVSRLQSEYYNDELHELLKNNNSTTKVILKGDRIIQVMDPIFNLPYVDGNPVNYRTHFFAPVKSFANMMFNTYYFNLAVIWMMTLALFITLYYDLLAKFVRGVEIIFSKLF